jgi:hypothetical protein
MTPQEACGLSPEVFKAFTDYANREIRALNRAARKRGR